MRAQTAQQREATRARLILMASQGWSNWEIGETIGMHDNQVGVWRRYQELGLAGLADEERPGRPHITAAGQDRHRGTTGTGKPMDDGGAGPASERQRSRHLRLTGVANLPKPRSLALAVRIVDDQP